VLRAMLEDKTPVYVRSYDRSYIDHKVELNRRKMAEIIEYRKLRLQRYLARQQNTTEVTQK